MKKTILRIVMGVFVIACIIVGKQYVKKQEVVEENKKDMFWVEVASLDTLPKENAYTYQDLVDALTTRGYQGTKMNLKLNQQGEEDVWYVPIQLPQRTITSSKEEMNTSVKAIVGLTYEGERPTKMVSLMAAFYDTGNQDSVFAGDILYILEDSKSFFIHTAGDIYQKGKMQVTSDQFVEEGGHGHTNSTIIDGDHHFKNVSITDRYELHPF